MYKTIKILSMAGVIAAIIFSISCKKGINNKGNSNMPDTANSTIKDRLYDTMYMYALQTYYWNSQLPTYASFLPRQYETSDTLAGLEAEQLAITRIPKDGSGNLYEQRIKYDQYGNSQPDNSAPKFSYILPTKETVNGGAASFVNISNQFTKNLKMTLDGKDSSFGFVVGILPADYSEDSTQIVKSGVATRLKSYITVVRWVTKGSPADALGLKRGDIISRINGDSLNFDKDDAGSVAKINSSLSAQNSTFTVYYPKKDSSADLHLVQKLYTFNPILKSTVLSYGGKKIAYLAFQSFSIDSSAKKVIDSAFQSYANQGITDLVVDLRYNGGGYINTAEDLVNHIAPSTSSGQVMYTSYYNQTMINKQASLLKKVPLDYNNPSEGTWADLDLTPSPNNPNTTSKIVKAGSVSSLTKVYFIVSSGTASASELVINSLKPYVTETLIGAAFSDNGKKTYGKPVGFFEIRFGQYSMWMPNFETKNKDLNGGYYQGFTTDYQDFDDIAHDFGDPKEECLARAIYLISGVNTYTTSYARTFNSINVQRAIMQTRAIGNPIKISDMVIKPKRNFGN
ncbi:MAG TPA: S41 family peptidase [Arachidicoccus soli]|nr:S41 family peptidase [Arachidicoccus soli]